MHNHYTIAHTYNAANTHTHTHTHKAVTGRVEAKKLLSHQRQLGYNVLFILKGIDALWNNLFQTRTI